MADSIYGICCECRKNLNMCILRKFWIETDREEAVQLMTSFCDAKKMVVQLVNTKA